MATPKLWTKREEGESKFYYSSNAGEIVTAEGTAYVFPLKNEEAIETTRFVPQEYAHEKIEVISNSLAAKKIEYEDRLSKLADFYKDALQKTKDHYNTRINEMKNNALRHVEVQSLLRKELEIDLNLKLNAEKRENESLHGQLVEQNMERQGEKRKLTATIDEQSKAIDSLQQDIDRFRSTAQQYQSTLAEHVTNFETKIRDLEDAAERRIVCGDVLRSVLMTIELNEYKHRLSLLEDLQAQHTAEVNKVGNFTKGMRLLIYVV
jgi:hypothetical protein